MVLADILRKKTNVYYLNGASEDEIIKAEKELGLNFAQGYREYLQQYALLSYGVHELTGLCKSARLNVVEATQREKAENDNLSDDMYLIEQVGVENLSIWQNSSGEIFEVPYLQKPFKLCDSLEEYISKD